MLTELGGIEEPRMLRGLELVNGTKHAERNASTRHTFTRPIGAGERAREGGISSSFFCFLCLVKQGDAIRFINSNLPRVEQASERDHACLGKKSQPWKRSV